MDKEATWHDLGLNENILKLVEKASYLKPTPVQSSTIPKAIEGKDLVVSAQTGTGKTASFVLPMVQRFAGRRGTLGLILAPTREIAQQIHATLEIFATPLGLSSVVLIGGINMSQSMKAIQSYPDIIVGTPGRICDHLERGEIWLDYIEMVALDEADRMLSMGFSVQLNKIMDSLPATRQTMLFSATFLPSVEKLANKILKNPVRVSHGKSTTAQSLVDQRVLWMHEDDKKHILMKLLKEETGSIFIFTRSKDAAQRLWLYLHSQGIYDATYLSSDRSQSNREQALADFKSGKHRILIATDVAGRGIHVDGVAHVINFELPMDAEDYIHRIGRTGRADATGKATSFVTNRDQRILSEIEHMMGSNIRVEGPGPRQDAPRGGGGDNRPRNNERSRRPPSRNNNGPRNNSRPAPKKSSGGGGNTGSGSSQS